MLSWFSNFFLGLWNLDLFLYPLCMAVIYSLFRLIYSRIGLVKKR